MELKRDVVILKSKRLVNSFLIIDQDIIRHRKFDGDLTESLSRLVVTKPNSIGILLYHKVRNTLILVEQFRYPAREDDSGWMIEIVAGNIEQRESIIETLRREVLEETGYRIADAVPIGQGYSSPGICTEKLFLYYSEVTDFMQENTGGGLKEEGEDIRVVEWSVAEAWNWLEKHEVIDLKTQLALQWFFLHKANQYAE